jgi:cation transporter-like permease
MTTSFAWIMRGRVVRSWQANPAGCLLALLSFPLIAWLIASAAANKPIGFQSLADPLMSLVLGAVVVSLVVWLVRLIVSPDALVGPAQNAGIAARAIGR